ncbi:Alpha/beta knot methyltransferase [Pavlovales sp. CCMP2436]|nr:Alpha/beta knot methyltransferase [Pavlovales sp. CCMP2436]|mmetsp:Transcript_12333/g.31144  ORF Transcript_12333/g.31144 Transcript_12333/m.31144 type:complete len:368 (+) Transcript_12333:110-1213(+)
MNRGASCSSVLTRSSVCTRFLGTLMLSSAWRGVGAMRLRPLSVLAATGAQARTAPMLISARQGGTMRVRPLCTLAATGYGAPLAATDAGAPFHGPNAQPTSTLGRYARAKARKASSTMHDISRPTVGLAPARMPPPGGPLFYGGLLAREPLIDALRESLKPSRLERIESRLAQRCSGVRLVLENIQDEHNAGACLRTFEGLGGQHVHVIETVDSLRPSQAVTKSCDRWLSLHHHPRVDSCFDELRSQGFTIIATHLSADSVPLDEIDFSKFDKVALIFGNERRGVSQISAESADICTVLPMSGFSQSFNISVAAALFLSHMRHVGKLTADMEADELRELYIRWLILANKSPKVVIERAGLADQVPWL